MMKPNKDSAKNEEEKRERSRSSYSELPEDEEITKSPKAKESKNRDIKESWMFRKNRSNREKRDPDRFKNGVNFKAKIIGIAGVFDARGNRMCQDAFQKLKAAVKSSGEHKQKILLNISYLGIQIKEEKTGEVLHHHPIHKISYISQDVNDNRAFGYVYGCPQTGHEFFGIKTEKTATQVIVTLRDLFNSALELKKKEIEQAIEHQKEPEDSEEQHNGRKETSNHQDSAELSENGSLQNENHVYSELVTNGVVEDSIGEMHNMPNLENTIISGCTVDNLLDLQFEAENLQQGITQMDSSIACAMSHRFGVSFSEDDSSVSSFPMTPRKLERMSSSYRETLSTSSRSSSTSDYTAYAQDSNMENFAVFKNEAFSSAETPVNPPEPEAPPPNIAEDRYAVFYQIDSLPSVFDTPHVYQPSMDKPSTRNCNQDECNDTSLKNGDPFGIDNSSSALAANAFPPSNAFGDQPFTDNFIESQDTNRKDFVDPFANPHTTDLFKSDTLSGCSQENVEDEELRQKSFNPFIATSPPKLPPKRPLTTAVPPIVTARKRDDVNLNNGQDSTISVKNPFNPFANCEEDFSDIPPPSSPPPPPPPPRLPVKDCELQPPVPLPPRPPVQAPVPPRPRRKIPSDAARGAWFSFDQDTLNRYDTTIFTTNEDTAPAMSPPVPIPLRKLPSISQIDYDVQKSFSASNSPSSLRRYMNTTSSLSSAIPESHNSHINGSVSKSVDPQETVCVDFQEVGVSQELVDSKQHGQGDTMESFQNPFVESSEVSSLMFKSNSKVNESNSSPALPPKSTSIARPRPSPSRKMMLGSSSSSLSNSSISSNQSKSTSSSMRYTNIDKNKSSASSASEILFQRSSSSQAEAFSSSGCEAEVSSENLSTENNCVNSLSPTSPDSIFRRKSDPFADDFFLSLPRRTVNGPPNDSATARQDTSSQSTCTKVST